MAEHIKTIFDNNINEFAENQKVSFKNLLLKFQDSFSKSSTDIGRTEMIEHTIDTGQALPVKQHPRRVPLSKLQEAEAEIEKMAEQGIIEPSTSPWCSPVVILRKKDSSIRFAIDCQRAVTIQFGRIIFPLYGFMVTHRGGFIQSFTRSGSYVNNCIFFNQHLINIGRVISHVIININITISRALIP
jgi:hypothetical protein